MVMSAGSFGESSSTSSFASEFEKLLNERMGDLRPGKIVKGTVVSVNKEVVTVDIGFKSDGVVPTGQFLNNEGKLNVKAGDIVDVFIVLLENDLGQVVLSKEKADQKMIWDAVEGAFKNKTIISGKVIQKVKGGLQVDIGIPAFLPGSQVDVRPHRNLDKFINQTFDFKVLKITRDKGNIVLSRRAVILSERDNLRSETLKVLHEGVVMEGVVKNLTEYGAFVDLGGIDGLLHVTDIAWGRVNHPSEKLSVGQAVPVVVLKYDPEKERVSLGMKQLKPDPWLGVHERYPVGGKVKGKVVTLAEYGAFVELEDGVEGLIHISEMSWTKKVRHPSKVLSEKQEVEAVVLGIDTEQQKISLGLKQLTPNPWDSLKERHPIGSRVTGKVRSITEFGVFIGVEDGIDGLVHVSDISWTKRITDPKELGELFKKGDDVEATVLGIDAENERLSLGIKQLTEDPWETIVQRYPVGAKIHGKVRVVKEFGVFVEIEGDVEGLIHVSQLGLDRSVNPADVYKVGETVHAEISNIDRAERRISLSIKAIKQREENAQMAGYMQDGGMSVTFGDLLKEKIDSGDR